MLDNLHKVYDTFLDAINNYHYAKTNIDCNKYWSMLDTIINDINKEYGDNENVCSVEVLSDNNYNNSIRYYVSFYYNEEVFGRISFYVNKYDKTVDCDIYSYKNK